MRALLEAAVAAGGKTRLRFTGHYNNAFPAAPPATAAGIKSGDDNKACVAALGKRADLTLEDGIKDLASPTSSFALQICNTWDATKETCICKEGETQDNRDAERISLAQANAEKGTDALLDLLANLLSPSKTLGQQMTLRTLAESVDNVRSKLYEQWKVKDELKQFESHIQSVASCAELLQCKEKNTGTRTVSTVAGESAHCRWKNLKTLREVYLRSKGNKPDDSILRTYRPQSKNEELLNDAFANMLNGDITMLNILASKQK